jgi:hypothetical protein
MIVGVSYVGMKATGARHYPAEPGDTVWDLGDWHWPEIAVKFTVADGGLFHAQWDAQRDQYDLGLGLGPSRWPAESACRWSVTGHPRWKPLIGSPITSSGLAFASAGEPTRPLVTMALRLATASAVAWVVSADPDASMIGCDDVVVIFDEDRAERLGLGANGGPRKA